MGKKRINGEGTFHYIDSRKLWHYKLVLGYDDNGNPIRKSFYGKSQQEAKAKGDTFKSERNAKPLLINVSPSIKLADWLDVYIDAYKRDAIKDTSVHQYELIIKRIPQSLKRKKITAISPAELQQFMNSFAQSASKSYTDKMRVLIKSAFAEAHENGIITANPARKLTSPKKIEPPREVYTAAETSTILQFASTYHHKNIAAGIALLLYTGIRRGEMLGIKYTDIENNVLHIRRGVFMKDGKPTVEEYQAKTAGSIRDIPLPPKVKALIDAVPRSGDYIFGTKSGKLMFPRNFNRDYGVFFEHLKNQYPDIRKLSVHCCRHTCATLTLTSGADIRTVQELLGHTDIKTTARYAHPDMTTLTRASIGLQSLLEQ